MSLAAESNHALTSVSTKFVYPGVTFAIVNLAVAWKGERGGE